jgi:hypothetical protein
MMRAANLVTLLILFVVGLLGLCPLPALAETRDADLEGFQEVPVISTTGSGTFRARIARDESSIDFVLSYDGLTGTVTQAHIHLGQRSVNGAIVIFLCTNLGNGPAGTPLCPAPPATISGTIEAGDVLAVAAQGIAAGELGEIIRAMREGVTYANVHSTLFPSGEIRGQIRGQGHDSH